MAQKKKETEPQQVPLTELHYFATPIYITHQPQFLEDVKAIAADSIKHVHGNKKLDKIYPTRMSGNMLEDNRITPFAEFVGTAAWEILSSQGYDMDNFSTTFTELWCQEHYQTSSMEYHAHNGSILVGFYFLDVPEGAPHAIVHDPRPARSMVTLPELDHTQATLASTVINFKPESGMLMFAPSWLPHSFRRNESKEPFRFVHFNLTVQQTTLPVCGAPTAEVI